MKFGSKATYEDEFGDDEKRKSQVKRELLALKELGRELLDRRSEALSK